MRDTPNDGLKVSAKPTDITNSIRPNDTGSTSKGDIPAQALPGSRRPPDTRALIAALGFDPDDPRVSVVIGTEDPLKAFLNGLRAGLDEKPAANDNEPETITVAVTGSGFPAVDAVLNDVAHELYDAVEAHGPMQSGHEGYAVLLEELDELWDEVKVKHPNPAAMRKEAIQVAAMAVRFVLDIVDDPATE